MSDTVCLTTASHSAQQPSPGPPAPCPRHTSHRVDGN